MRIKQISFNRLLKELHLETKRDMVGKAEKPPSITTIKNIIKAYEDLIVLYTLGNYRICTRLGTWKITRRNVNTVAGRRLEVPVTTYYMRLTVAKKVKNIIQNNKDLIDKILDSNRIVSLPPERFNEIKWELNSPERDLR